MDSISNISPNQFLYIDNNELECESAVSVDSQEEKGGAALADTPLEQMIPEEQIENEESLEELYHYDGAFHIIPEEEQRHRVLHKKVMEEIKQRQFAEKTGSRELALEHKLTLSSRGNQPLHKSQDFVDITVHSVAITIIEAAGRDEVEAARTSLFEGGVRASEITSDVLELQNSTGEDTEIQHVIELERGIATINEKLLAIRKQIDLAGDGDLEVVEEKLQAIEAKIESIKKEDFGTFLEELYAIEKNISGEVKDVIEFVETSAKKVDRVIGKVEELRENSYDSVLLTVENTLTVLGAVPGFGIAITGASISKNAVTLRSTSGNIEKIKKIKEKIMANEKYDSSLDVRDLPCNYKGVNGLENLEGSQSPMLTRLAKTMQYASGKLESRAMRLSAAITGGLLEIGGGAVALSTAPSGIGAGVGLGVALTGFIIAGAPLLYRLLKCSYKIFRDTRGVNRNAHANFLHGLALYALVSQGKVSLEVLKKSSPEACKSIEFIDNLKPSIQVDDEEFLQAGRYALEFLDQTGIFPSKQIDNEKELQDFLFLGNKAISEFMKST